MAGGAATAGGEDGAGRGFWVEPPCRGGRLPDDGARAAGLDLPPLRGRRLAVDPVVRVTERRGETRAGGTYAMVRLGSRALPATCLAPPARAGAEATHGVAARDGAARRVAT